MNKRGLSGIIAALILVFISIIAVAILWMVFSGVTENSEADADTSNLLVSVQIDPLSVLVDFGEGGNISLKVKRAPGAGDLDSLKFILFNGTDVYEEIQDTTLNELDQKRYVVSLGNLPPFSLEKITVIPVLKNKEGKREYAYFGEQFDFRTNRTSTIYIGSGRDDDLEDNNDLPPSDCTAKTCSDYYNLNCGTFIEDACSSELNCESNCNSSFSFCWEGAGEVTNICVNNSLSCVEPSNLCLDSINLTDYSCYYNSTGFELRNQTVFCDNGCGAGECLGECVLSFASWSVTNAVEGEVVQLLVTGENCNSKQFNYTIYEDDGFFTGDATASFISDSLIETWTAIYEPDWIGNPEFYFKVFPVDNSDGKITSDNSLSVSQLVVPPVCGDGAIEGSEVCETNPLDLNGESCISQGFDSGDLDCVSDCLSFDTISCVSEEPGSSVINFVYPTPENLHVQLDTSTYVNVSSNMGESHSTFIDFDNSLVSWWRMDDVDGNILVDYMGRNDGTITEAVQTDSGALGKAYDFDGVNDRVVVSHSSDLYFSNPELTFSLWVNIDTIKESDLFEKENYYGPVMWLSSNPSWKLSWGQQNYGPNMVQSTIYPAVGGWTHIVGTYDGSTLKLYFDGVLNAQKNVAGFSKSNTNPLTIGEGIDGWFDGSIDDFMIFNRSLNEEEVSALYANISSRYLGKQFIELSQGTHKFKAYSQDILGNVSETEERILEVSDGNLLINPSPVLTSVRGTDDESDDLNCSSVVLDTYGGILDASVVWYKNGIENINFNYTGYSSGNSVSSILDSENTIAGDSWSCKIRIYNVSDFSDWVDSNSLTILPTLLCGNGILDSGEECDLAISNGIVCSATYDGSCTYCNSSCSNVIVQGSFCGDGTCDLEEDYSTCSSDCEEILIPENQYTLYRGADILDFGITNLTVQDVGLFESSDMCGYVNRGGHPGPWMLSWPGGGVGEHDQGIMFYFNLSDIPPGTNISNAYLQLYVYDYLGPGDVPYIPIRMIENPLNYEDIWYESDATDSGCSTTPIGVSWRVWDNRPSPDLLWSNLPNPIPYLGTTGSLSSVLEEHVAGSINFTNSVGNFVNSTNLKEDIQKIINGEMDNQGWYLDVTEPGYEPSAHGSYANNYLYLKVSASEYLEQDKWPRLIIETVNESVQTSCKLNRAWWSRDLDINDGNNVRLSIDENYCGGEEFTYTIYESDSNGDAVIDSFTLTSQRPIWNATYASEFDGSAEVYFTVSVVGNPDAGTLTSNNELNVLGEASVIEDAPSNYLVEYVGEGGVTINTDYSTQPEKGEFFIDSVTGHRVTRVSDISEFYPSNDGNPSAGFYNGYAPYTNVNYLGDVVIAYQTSQRTALYNLSNYELIHELGLGESHDPRWDLSGRAGTEYDLYYASGSKFYKMNVLTLEKTILMDMGYTIWPDDHMSQSTDARYRAGRLWQVPGMPYDYTIFVYDMYENKILPGFVEGSSYDISPDGKYLFSGLKFYFISDLINNITNKSISHPTASYGHNGWSYDYNGDVVHVFQDNRNDWFSSFNPATGERVDFAYFTDFGAGWNLGQHIARIQNPDKKGWALMGTYVKPGVDGWGVNQIFMVELKPKRYANGSLTSLEDRPRIFRISPAYNGAYATADSGKDYFAEAFASIDLIGNNVYVGSNWNRTDNLELYRIELPSDWYEVLSGDIPVSSCELNSATWSASTVQVYDSVTLNVIGSDCVNKYINYTVKKVLWYWFDKKIMTTSTTGSTTWTPTEKGDYYFEAIPEEGGNTITSGNLEVTALPISSVTTFVTKRFGECETCDVTGVAMDTMVDSKYPDNNAGDGDLYFRSGNQPVFYFNLSNISSDANITKAVFTLYRWRDYYDGGLTGITKPIYALTNPDNTEMWDESEITYNNKKAGVPWVSSGDMSSVYGNQIGRIYFKNWMSGGQSFWTMDITDDVQSWVNNSSNNFGFTFENNANFNKGFYGKEAIDLSLRPYLEVTYTGIQDEVIPQVSDIQSKYYSGQTFISWKEATTGVNETSYKIYRYGSPITSANLKDAELIDQVYQGSSYFSDCIYYTCDFGRQPDLNKAGISLSPDSGLYVYTVENAQDSYYAVTTVVEGNENREIFENQNTISSSITETIDIPQAFVLNSEGHTGYVGYVMFLSKFNSANPSDIYGLHNKKSAPFLFSIVVPHKVTSEKGLTQYQAQTNQNVFDSYTEKFPLTFYLHTISSGSGNYFASGEGYDNSLVVGDNYGGFSIGIQDNYHLLVKTAEGQIMSIGTYLDNAHQAGYSYYSGWNSNYVPVDNINGFKSTFEEQKPFDEGVNVMYTEKSLKFLIDWLDNYSPFSQWIDENRVYFTGNSMGGGGSLFMGIRYPNDIAAINVYKGRTIILPGTDRSTAQQRVLGSLTENIPVEDGTPVYDYTNMTWYVQNHPGDYPYMRLKHGKMDTTIKWVDSEIPAFYDTISNGKIGFVAYWDQSTHQGDLDYSFVEKVNDRQFVVEMDNDGFNIFNFRLNESYISFTDFSLNENPGDGDPLTGDQIGGINRYTWFNRSTISDDSNYYEVEIYLLDEAPQDSATVTITPRRLQNLVHTSGTSYNWIFGVQSGTVTADENGLLTINGLQMSKERTKLIIGDEIVFLSPMTGMAIDENVTDEVNLSDSPNEEILDENITLEDIPSNETIGEILLNITENITDNFAAIIIIIMVLVLAIGGYVILIRMRLRVKKRRGAVRIR